MEVLSANGFNFDELDMETIDSVMKGDVDLFSEACANGDQAFCNEADMIDEFLNLDRNKQNTGIYIENEKHLDYQTQV